MKNLIIALTLLFSANIFAKEEKLNQLLDRAIGMDSLCKEAQDQLVKNKKEIISFKNTKLKLNLDSSNERHKIIKVTDKKNHRYHLVFVRHDNAVIQKIETYNNSNKLLSKYVAIQSMKVNNEWVVSHARVDQTEVSCPVQNKLGQQI